MWKGIHFSFKPVQAYRHHCGEKTFIGPNLYQLWLQFQLERHEMVHTGPTRGPIKKTISRGGLSCFQYKLSFLAHCSHGLLGVLLQHGNAAILANRVPSFPDAAIDGVY